MGEKLSLSDRIKNSYQAAKKQKQRIEAVSVISSVHLGGLFQKYSADGWLKEAEALSGSKIYLA